MSKKTIKDYLPILVTTSFLLFIIFWGVITKNDSILIFYGDSIEQHYPFLLAFWEKLRNLDFAQWDWSVGFGAKTMIFSFYPLFSPFTWFVALFSKSVLANLTVYFVMIKFVILSLSSYLWLRRITKSYASLYIGTILLTFSGYTFYNLGQHFIDVIVFLPLILFSVDKIVDNKSPVFLILSVFLVTIINFYFSYMMIPLAFLYYIFRFIQTTLDFNLNDLILKGVKLTLFYLVGLGLSAFVLFPSIFTVLSVPRVKNLSINPFVLLTKFDLYRNITNIFSPTVSFQNASFYLKTYEKTRYLAGAGTSFYTIILSTSFLPLIFWVKDKKTKILFISLAIVLSVLMIFPIFSIILNGDYNTRWYFMFMYTIIIYITFIIDEILLNQIPKYAINVGLIFSIGCIFIFTLISNYYSLHDFDYLQKLAKMNTVLIGILIVYLIVVNLNKKFRFIIIFLMFSELIFNGNIFIENYGILNSSDIPILSQDEKFIKNLEESDKSFHRIIFGGYDLFSMNVPIAFQYPGVSFYSSLYTAEQQKFLDRLISSWSLVTYSDKYRLYNLLSTKYWIPSEKNTKPPFGYIANNESSNGYYLNEFYVELGFNSNKTINNESVESLPFLLQDRIMQEYIVTEDSINQNYVLTDNLYQLLEYVQPEYIEYVFDTVQNDSILYIENFGAPEVSLEVYSGEDLIDSQHYYQFNYIDYYITPDSDVSKVIIKGKDTFNYGATINLYLQENATQFEQNIYQIRKDSSLGNVQVNPDNISTTIDVNSEGTLFTSIPFDSGWSAYVNGERVNIKKVNFGFVGLDLKVGKHELVFKYDTPFLNVGIYTSIICLILTLIIGFSYWKKAKLTRLSDK